MHLIPWKTCSTKTNKVVIADIGDIRLILSKSTAQWTLSMGIRVYNADKTKSMVRPPATVLTIPMPCELDEAMDITQEYFNNFLSSVLEGLR